MIIQPDLFFGKADKNQDETTRLILSLEPKRIFNSNIVNSTK